MRVGSKALLAAAMIALILASTSLWHPPPSTSSAMPRIKGLRIGRVGLRGGHMPSVSIEVTSAASIPTAPSTIARVAKHRGGSTYRYPWLLTAILNLLRSAWNALLNALNQLYRGLFMVNPSHSGGGSGRASPLISYSALAAAIACIALASYLLRRREGLSREVFTGFKYDVLGEEVEGTDKALNDPVVKAIKLLALKVSEELGRRAESLTHRDVLKASALLKGLEDVSRFIKLYEMWRFAGEGVRDECLRLAESIIKRLGAEE